MEGRGKSRRRNPYQTWKRRASAMLAVLLTLSLVLGDISGLSRTVMAGQRSVKEEFRIHREAILKAAEEAIEKGEPLSQPLAITSDEEKTETKYQELLAADGTVYEIFPEIEQVQDVDSLELRVFIRLEEGADPASYTLTGEEELIFLYVNGGGVTAEGRVNIDGYVSDFIEVEPLEEEDDAVWTVGSGNAGSGNTGSGNTGSGNAGGSGNTDGAGSGTDNGEAAGSNETSENIGNAGNEIAGDETASAESETTKTESEENINTNTSSTLAPEDSAADLTQGADEEEADDETTAPDSNQKPEDTLPAETEENEEAEETEADKKEDAGKPEKNPAESGADASAETGDKTDEKETSESMDKDESADKDATDKEVIGDADKEEDTDNYEKKDETEAAGDESEDKDEDKNTSTSDEEQDENTSDDDAADTNDAEDADAKDDTGSAVTVSLRQIQRVAASLASDSDAEKETTGSAENGSNGSGSNGTGSTGVGGTGSGSSGAGSGSAGSGNTGAGNKNSSNDSGDDEDSYYENTGDPFDEEDAVALEDEEAVFKKVKNLDGTRYDEAVMDEVLAIRAFVVSMEEAGFDKEELLEGAHHLTYTVSEGEARVVYNPEYVRDEAVVTFGIIPAEGMEVYQVTANGEALAETEKTAAIASASEAKRASSSDADVDEERAVYYQIPEVLEDQDVQIQVVKEGYNSHPAFLQSRTVNGVTVTVSAEEGILPAGTELSVEEVTEQVADAVAEKITKDSGADSPKQVTSIIAYDINLILNGEKLPNDWSQNGTVDVTFSGNKVEEMSAEAEKIEIFALDDQNKEEVNAENVDSVSPETLILEPIQEEAVIGEIREAVSYQAEHFTIYVVSGTTERPVQNYTMQVGESIVVYSDHVTYSSWSTKWNSTNSNVITISNETSKRVNREERPQATITAKKAGQAIVTVSTWSILDGSESDTFNIQVLDTGKRTVTFNANGASGKVPDPITNIESGSEVTLPDADELSKNRYSFIGWSKEQFGSNDEQMGQGKRVIYPAGSELLVNESITLYAVWAEKSPENVEVQFFLRLDGRIQNEPSGVVGGTDTAQYTDHNLPGMFFVKNSDKQPVLKEKKFVTDPTGEAVLANLNVVPTEEAIVNAINTKPDAISSNYGVVGRITLKEYQENFRVIWYVLKIPGSNDGHWHVDGVLLRKDKVTLAYDINCNDPSLGSTNPVGGSYEKNERVTVAGHSSFSRPGYEFIGWNTKADGSGKWYQPDDTIVMLEDTVLYAQWQNATAQLAFKKLLVGGSGDVTQVSFSLYKATESWEKDGNTPVKSNINPNSNGLVSIQLAHDAGNKRYLLYEDTSAPGYEGLTEPLKIEVSFDGNNQITYQVNGNTNNTYSVRAPYEIVNSYVGIAFKVNKYLRNGTEGIDQVGKVTFQLRKLNEAVSDENFGKYEDFGSVVSVSPDPNTTTSGYAIFTSMPIGEYQLVELSTTDGYMLHEAIDLKVGLDENGDIQLWEKDENDDWVVVSKVNKNMPEITVYNEQGAELPETGGPGLIMMERFGWILLLLAMAGMEIQIFSRRRRKEQ